MSASTLKIIDVGNSKGVILPAKVLKKYRMGDLLTAEEQDEGIFLKPAKPNKLGWEDTFKQMALDKSANEDFSDLDNTLNDGETHL